jgi:Putative peptidoglycan binding domain
VVAAALVVLLAACGGGGGGDTSADSTATSTTAATAATTTAAVGATTTAPGATTTVAGASTTSGSPADQAKALQAALAAVGCYAGPVDGVIGPVSLAAVKEFQSTKGLVVDGVAGPQTQAALQQAVAAGETVCGVATTTTAARPGAATTAGTAAPPTPTVRLATSDGIDETLAVVSCTSDDQSSFELLARSATTEITASATAEDGSIVVSEGGGVRAGTIDVAQVDGSSRLSASGMLRAGGDASSPATFQLTGTCTTP